MKSLRFRRLDDPQGVTTVEAVRIEAKGLSPVAFWPGGTALDHRFDWTRPLPPNSEVMVLPATEPRPSGDRTANIVEAAALTPVMFAADLVVDPIAGFLWVAGGEPGGVICATTPASPARKQWKPAPVPPDDWRRLALDSHRARAVSVLDDRGT